MGKKDKKKQGLGKAKTEAKAAKKESKARRKNIADAGEQDVEAILAELLAKEEADAAVTMIPGVPAPSPPRAAFTMVASPTSDTDLIFFGGERFTGERAAFYNDLHVYNIDKDCWTRYDSATRPPPRSGHAVACYKNFVYCFGGEFSNPSLSQYRHYRDLWRLDTEDMGWEKLDIRGGPSARSGHRMCVVKGRLVVFGGYIDQGIGGDNKYLNDMYSIDLTQDELKWIKTETSAVDIVPTPRSGFQWAVFDNEVILYGGYRREKASKQISSSHKTTKKGGASASEEAMVSRGVVLTDMFRLNGETLKWQKVKRIGYGPSQRSGFSLVAHKRTFVTFGGVEDEETEEDLGSTFYSDCFGWSFDRKRFYPMTVRKKKKGGGGGGRRRKREDATAAAIATAAAAGAAAASPMDEDTDGDDDEEDEDDDDAELDTAAMEAALRKQEEEELAPCGRFNACTAVQKNIMYVAGGLVEKKEADVSLDDMWCVDLNKMNEWRNIKPLSAECAEWVESDSDDDDEDDEDDDDMEDSDDDGVDESTRKKQRRQRLQDRVADSDDYQTPKIFELLRDYHARTAPYWIGEVRESRGDSGKQLRRTAFEWCYRRYMEIKPTLRELEELEEEIAAEAKLEEEFAKAQVEAKRSRTRR
jgi:Domain of unknown function (DUF4110)/Galactose oxidase, central domain/Kelch motif